MKDSIRLNYERKISLQVLVVGDGVCRSLALLATTVSEGRG